MTGTNLQILDRSLAIMDVTYSSAWQLGRTMAIADSAFTSALFRVRCQILQCATPVAQGQLAKQQGFQHKSKLELLGSLSDSIARLGALHDGTSSMPTASMTRRWMRDTNPVMSLSIQSDGIQAFLADVLEKAAMEVASTPLASDATQPDMSKPYNEFNTPFSADWVVILRWLLDRMFFGNVPAHYLLSDASNLPPESVRFFNIDKIWMDLSV